jgi:sulfur carrier protein ThiS
MRIAISGTHCMGKTTLIQDFLKIHPEYLFEEEPYYQLQEKHGVEFSEELTLEDFIEQLDYSVAQLNLKAVPQNIIFERCPIDFVAYVKYTAEQEEIYLENTSIPEKFSEIKEALENLDLIVFLPMTKENPIRCTESEDMIFRKAIDGILKQIYREELFDLFPRYDHPQIAEIWGSPQERIKKLEEEL